MATFVEMYHPQVPETAFKPARMPLDSVDDWAALGWLLVSGAPLPEPSTPYYTKAAADSRFLTETAARAALERPAEPVGSR